MRSEKKNESWLFRFFYLLLLTSCFFLLISLAACGRRGDPVALSPYEEKAVISDLKQQREHESGPVTTAIETDKDETDEVEFAVPDSPTGLDALYTQKKSIILTWDEIIGRGVMSYKIYRSAGDGFVWIGDSTMPVFTDRDVKENIRYFYRVTAFGSGESPPSKEIEIFTGVR